jgi:hypothetical protein
VGATVNARRAARFVLLLAGLTLAALSARAVTEPVLHEYIEHFVGQTSSSPFASLNDSPANTARRPPASPSGPRTPGSEGTEEAAGDELAGDGFRIDSDTTQPESVSYSDPFTPAVAPFKRLVAYDAVDAEFELFVFDRRLKPVPTRTADETNAEHFHAALDLALSADEASRIPSIGPGAWVRVAHTEPNVPFELVRDSAENWFVRSPHTGNVRLVLQIAIDRRSFGDQWPTQEMRETHGIGPRLPPVPDVVRENAREVAEVLGIPKGATALEIVPRLVDHFRRFRPSERRVSGQGAALYRQLAISRRGVCRHRAYAFVVTALGLGIPARFVHNEAHAWVEVSYGSRWQRVDLGGAAGHMQLDSDARPRHVQPHDPFGWPDGSDSGNALVERSLSGPSNDLTPAPEPAPSPTASATQPVPPAAPSPTASATADPSPNPADVTLVIAASQSNALRGQSLEVSGGVARARQACRQVPVEVALKPTSGDVIPLGTLLSDEHGHFNGRLVVPWSLPVGDYTLSAASPEAAQGCQP